MRTNRLIALLLVPAGLVAPGCYYTATDPGGRPVRVSRKEYQDLESQPKVPVRKPLDPIIIDTPPPEEPAKPNQE